MNVRKNGIAFLVVSLGLAGGLAGCGTIIPGATDARLSVYGNGSAGSVDIGDMQNLNLYTGVAADGNLQFDDLTIRAGARLAVPTGTVIRCKGACTILGKLDVLVVPFSGGAGWFVSGLSLPVAADPAASFTGSHASSGSLGVPGDSLFGGSPGSGTSTEASRNLLMPGYVGGGGGAGTILGFGAHGGGTLLILAREGITIGATGEINANGMSAFAVTGGGGGGGGGVIVLASLTEVINAGVIRANGGAGGPSDTQEGAGGGGGGGIIHMLAPMVTPGMRETMGGASGVVSAAGSVAASRIGGGGGGGGSGGIGGNGGGVGFTGNPLAPGVSLAGFQLVTLVDPTDLY